jgi:hypothetical protein
VEEEGLGVTVGAEMRPAVFLAQTRADAVRRRPSLPRPRRGAPSRRRPRCPRRHLWRARR